jgi:hypothetical protein
MKIKTTWFGKDGFIKDSEDQEELYLQSNQLKEIKLKE